MCNSLHATHTKAGQETLLSSTVRKIGYMGAAAVYTICSINFIFSKDSRLSLSSSDICEYFGTSSSTTAQKSKTIRELLKISQVFDPNFSLKEIADLIPSTVSL